MLGVDGEDRATVLLRDRDEKFAGEHHRFFVRERDALTGLKRRHGRPEPRASDERVHDHVRIRIRREAREALFPLEHLAPEAASRARGRLGIGQRDPRHAEFLRGRNQCRVVRAGGHRDEPNTAAEFPRQLQSRSADRAGRAEKRCADHPPSTRKIR